LHKLVGVAYATAFSILKKITVAAQNAMQEHSTVQVSSSLFVAVFTRRSRETPRRQRPVTEEGTIDGVGDQAASQREPFVPLCGDLSPDPDNLDAVELDQAEVRKIAEPTIEDQVERAIFECLSHKPVTYDALCEKLSFTAGELSAALTLLELSGLAKRLPGEQYLRSAPAAAVTTGDDSFEGPHRKLVDRIVDYIRNNFGGISRKYLQNYLWMHWCQAKEKKRKENSLLNLCLNFRSVSHNEILDYVSPRSVQVVLTET